MIYFTQEMMTPKETTLAFIRQFAYSYNKAYIKSGMTYNRNID